MLTRSKSPPLVKDISKNAVILKRMGYSHDRQYLEEIILGKVLLRVMLVQLRKTKCQSTSIRY